MDYVINGYKAIIVLGDTTKINSSMHLILVSVYLYVLLSFMWWIVGCFYRYILPIILADLSITLAVQARA